MSSPIEHVHLTKYRMDREKVEKILDVLYDGSFLEIDPNNVMEIHVAEGICTITTMELLQ